MQAVSSPSGMMDGQKGVKSDLTVKNGGGARGYTDGVAAHPSHAVEVDASVVGHTFVVALGNSDVDVGVVGIENDDDVVPSIAAGMTGNLEGHHAVSCREEGEVLANEFRIAKTEGRMVVAQPDKVAVIVEDFGVGVLAAPVDGVDGVGRIVAVVYALSCRGAALRQPA